MPIREGEIVNYHWVHRSVDESVARTRPAIVSVLRENGRLGLHVLFVPGDVFYPGNGPVVFVDNVSMRRGDAQDVGFTWSHRGA